MMASLQELDVNEDDLISRSEFVRAFSSGGPVELHGWNVAGDPSDIKGDPSSGVSLRLAEKEHGLMNGGWAGGMRGEGEQRAGEWWVGMRVRGWGAGGGGREGDG